MPAHQSVMRQMKKNYKSSSQSHCRNITRCSDNQYGFAIVDTVQFVHVPEEMAWGDAHCKATIVI